MKRRKVHREAIFKYLAAEKLAVPPSSEKSQLIQYAINHWAGPKVHKTPTPEKKVSRAKVYRVYMPAGLSLSHKVFTFLEEKIWPCDYLIIAFVKSVKY